jgi:hypothetical protein
MNGVMLSAVKEVFETRVKTRIWDPKKSLGEKAWEGTCLPTFQLLSPCPQYLSYTGYSSQSAVCSLFAL